MGSILVIDDEKSMRDFMGIMLEKDGYDATVAETSEEALYMIRNQPFDLVLSDMKMPKFGGMDILNEVKKCSPQTPVILLTAYGSAESAVEAMKKGAYDYITKPFKVDEVKLTIKKALEKKKLTDENITLKGKLRKKYVYSNFIGRSPQMLKVFEMIRRVAASKTSIMVTGESGTGKELVAKAIHYNSMRKNGPFVSISCGAMPETLLESELFGYQKGAFTSADSNKAGLLEVANGGTFLLDEIGEAPMSIQVKLLRVLQEMEFKRVGGTKDIKVDVRIIAVTNRDLKKCVEDGTFREDLYYRLHVILLHLPPLRERKEDIPCLVEHFIKKYSASEGKNVQGITQNTMMALENYGWPGNIRELENVVERMVVLERGTMINEENLPQLFRKGQLFIPAQPDLEMGKVDLEKLLEETERDFLLQALEKANGTIIKAAGLLGLSFRSMRYKLQKYGIQKKEQ